MSHWTKQDFFTYLSLFVLLFIRFPSADFTSYITNIFRISISSVNMENLLFLQRQAHHLYFNYAFALVLLVVIVNRNSLKELNIDKPFIFVLLTGAFSYNWAVNSKLSLLVGITMVISLAVIYAKGWMKFGDIDPKLPSVIFATAILFFIGILFISGSMNFGKIVWSAWWYKKTIAGAIVEEVLFRGALWAFLRKLNFSEFRIISLQAIFFWLSNIDTAGNDPVFFWVITPIAGIILGILVWRTRSLTSSVSALILFNIWWGLFEMYRLNI